MSEGQAYMAGGTILTASFVKIDATKNHTVLQCGAGEVAFGVAQLGGNNPPLPTVTDNPTVAAAAGQQLKVFKDGQECLLRAGTGGFTAGAYVRSGANGTGVALAGTAATVENYGAIAMESAAAGELGRVMVKIGTRTNPA